MADSRDQAFCDEFGHCLLQRVKVGAVHGDHYVFLACQEQRRLPNCGALLGCKHFRVPVHVAVPVQSSAEARALELAGYEIEILLREPCRNGCWRGHGVDESVRTWKYGRKTTAFLRASTAANEDLAKRRRDVLL